MEEKSEEEEASSSLQDDDEHLLETDPEESPLAVNENMEISEVPQNMES